MQNKIRKKCVNPECDLNVGVEKETDEKLCAPCAMYLKYNKKTKEVTLKTKG